MWFRTLLVWALGVPITLFLFPFALVGRLVDGSGSLTHRVGGLWCRVVLWLSGVKVEIRGRERLPHNGTGYVFAANHKGAFDIPVLQAYLPCDFKWIAKKSLFYIPFVGWAMWLSGYIPIDRRHGGRAYVKSIGEAIDRVKRGTSVIIFPEGTRHPEKGLLPFKKGGFVIAIRSGADVVPLAISGTEKVMPKGSLTIRPAKVRINIGSAVSSKGLDDRSLSGLVREQMERLLEEIEDSDER